jgi:glycosyltransferase involved in cell wall biosynthesis
MSRTKTGSSKIRIAILLPSLRVGGAERLVLEELAFMKDDPRFSFEVHLVFDGGELLSELDAMGIPVRIWNAPHKSLKMIRTYWRLARYLRASSIDILHVHLLNGIGPIAGKLAGAFVVSTVHSDARYGIVERFGLGRSDLVLGCGRKVCENVGGFLRNEKVALLGNAIRSRGRDGVRREDVLERIGVRKEQRLVVSLGRMNRKKGFDVLIRAFRKVVEAEPDAVLLIGGEGCERGRLAEIAKTLGLENRVLLPGLIREPQEVLEAADLYVNSSRQEGLPMTLLEAMAQGKPVVATGVGGNPEVVRDGETGLLVPTEDPDALGDAVVRMLRDGEFRNRVAESARRMIRRDYRIDRHCDALAAHYCRLMQTLAVFQ